MIDDIIRIQFWSIIIQLGILIIAALIGGVILLVKRGGKEGLWFAIPIFSLVIAEMILDPGAILWIIIILVLYLYIKPKDKKWSEKKESYWFSIGTVTAFLMVILSSFITYFLV